MTSSSQPLAALLHVSLLRPKEPLITLKKERQKCALFSIATSSKLLNLPPHIQVIFIRRIRVYDFTVTNDYGAKMHGCCRLVYNFNCVFTTLITQNSPAAPYPLPHSTVTLLARLRGLSTSVPRAQAVW